MLEIIGMKSSPAELIATPQFDSGRWKLRLERAPLSAIEQSKRPNHGFRNHLSACCPQWGGYWRRYFVWHLLVESANSGQGSGAGAQAFATRGVIQAFHRDSFEGLCRLACSSGGECRGNYGACRFVRFGQHDAHHFFDADS